ncbi:MAG: 3-oxoacyl-ACP reductase FabG [Candidatus Zixiibacteriota bacterium]|nr:MAG: 3-oxoacyl-ACP reductase FabG [candidate division Zixibacteria bacterium]
MINLKNKVTLVTGGSRGIGRAVCLLFAGAGSDVIINYRSDRRSAADVRKEAEKLGVRAFEMPADVSDKKQVDAMVETAIREFGKIDVLVNNAGIWKYHPIDEMTDVELKETLDINLLGSFYAAMAVVPHMKERKSGVIINISSTAGQRGEAYHSPYAASKGAVISLTKSLAAELAEYNIRVNCVAPGWVETDISRDALSSEQSGDILRQIPLGRVASPEEIAGPVLFLASDLAGFVTGEILNANGGAVLCG